jgi:hypothetical protein
MASQQMKLCLSFSVVVSPLTARKYLANQSRHSLEPRVGLCNINNVRFDYKYNLHKMLRVDDGHFDEEVEIKSTSWKLYTDPKNLTV